MTVPSEARVTQRAEEVAEDVTSAANIVTNGGYYEIDTNAVTAAITRFEAEVRQSATAPLIEAIEAAREALEPALDFVLRYSNRWDGTRCEHPSDTTVRAREALTRLTGLLAEHGRG